MRAQGALLDVLLRRGQEGVDVFCQALTYVRRDDLVSLLRSPTSEDMDVCFPSHSTFHLGGDVYLEVTRDGLILKTENGSVHFPVIRWINLRGCEFFNINYYIDCFKQNTSGGRADGKVGGGVKWMVESSTSRVVVWYCWT